MPDITSRLSAALEGRYVIERELGQGGMATVYLAHDVKHDRKVALKVLRPELAAVIGAERFLQEIKVTANLQHSHILPLYDSGAADGFLYYVMPYVEGETLRTKLDKEKQLGVDNAIAVARGIAGALEHAHKQGVIHRDIKPENILLRDNDPLIADFGIALALAHAGGNRLTETGLSIGTPHYMSPEQAMGDRETDARSDVYSLGAVLYEMLVGDPPYTGSTAQAIVAKVITEKAPPVTALRDTVPEHVSAAIAKALAKLPADRFPSAASFAEALARPGMVVTPEPRTAPPAVTRSARQRVGRAAAVAAFAALGAVALWGWLTARSVSRQPVTWQYISLGDSVRLTMLFPALALSPDGNTLVFKDNAVNGLLWVKQRGQLRPTAIPGTERANVPVFSPDGEWVAFVADGRLRKVRASGGAAVTLADTVAGVYGGATWLDDGTLVYVVPALNELRRVSASGGEGTVALRDTSLVGGGMGYPVALPGARGVLFQYCGSSCVTMRIHVLDLRTGRQKLLLEDVVQAWYLPSGHLMYVRRDGVVLAAPFDLDALEITGEAVPVLEEVDAQPQQGFAPLAWSASGALVYVQRRGPAIGTVIVRVTREGVAVPIDTSWVGAFNSLALSPDGRRLAVGSGVGTGLNIWIKQLDRGPFTRLSFGNADRRPVWSPDGRSVAFIRDTVGTSAVYARPVDGSGPDRFMASLDRQIQEVFWSADSRWLLLRTDNGAVGAGDLVGVRTTGDTTPVPLVASEFSELHPALSPDGRWLAYSSNESGILEVYVRPFPNTSAGRWQVSNGGGAEPVWSATGREIFYVAPTGQLMAAQVSTDGNFFVSELRPLFDASALTFDGFHQSYAVTADGRHFIFNSPRFVGQAQLGPQLVWVDHWFTALRSQLAR
jgi:serine/threonine-protein kinase